MNLYNLNTQDLGNNFMEESSALRNKTTVKTIFIFLILNSIILLGILGIMIYGFCYLLPEKIEAFSSLLNNFQSYGNDIDEFSGKFDQVYDIIITLCNKTKLCT